MKNLILLVLMIICVCCCQPEKTSYIFERKYVANSQLPALISNSAGELYLSEVETQDKVNLLSLSKIKGEEVVLTRLIAAGEDWFVNWADYPSVQIFPDGDNIFLHWLEKSGEGTYDYDIKFKIYTVSADSSSQAFKLNDSETHGEYGFVSSTPYKDGIQLVWLDGRNSKHEEGFHNEESHSNGKHPAMSLRSSFLKSDGSLSPSVELDPRVCDCCQTAVVSDGDKLYVQYRDRSDTEVRDISMVTFDEKWSEPQEFSKDDWTIAGCPVNGPVLDIKNNVLASAWYTQDEDTTKVMMSFYNTESENEISRFLISDNNTSGRLDIAMINQEEALVSYMENKTDFSEIKIAHIHRKNGLQKTLTLAKNTITRSAGFPEIEIVKDKVYYTYYDELKTNAVQIAYIAVSSFYD